MLPNVVLAVFSFNLVPDCDCTRQLTDLRMEMNEQLMALREEVAALRRANARSRAESPSPRR